MSGDSYERRQALQDAVDWCVQYANSLAHEKRDWSDVALECAAIIEENGKLVPTITENGVGCRQDISSFFVIPEIDYTSGLP